jgi:hypothetical protein
MELGHYATRPSHPLLEQNPHGRDLSIMTTSELTLAQAELLRGIPQRFAAERLDRIWIFAPHVVRSRESGFVVLSLLPQPGEDPDRRTLVTLRYEAEQVKGETVRQERVDEEGSAPCERIERVIAGVLARSGAESPDPRSEEIDGRADRWLEILEKLGVAP